MDVIKFKDVWQMYRIKFVIDGKACLEEFHALKGINFNIKKEETVGIIGENGAGKSTILKLIMGILKPDQGEIEVNARVSGLLELGAGFQPESTGRENIYSNAALFGLTQKQVNEKYEDIVNFASLGKFINAPIKCYSQGMFVRLAFAIAIHMDSDVLLIDDTFAVGDEYFQRKCIKKIFELKEEGRTVIFVTHDINMLKRICNRAIFIKEGEIIKDDSTEKVIPLYTQLVGQKQSVGILKQNALALVFNNGRIFLNWQDRLITPNYGVYTVFIATGKWYYSLQADWEIKMQSQNKLTAIGKFFQLAMIQVWNLELTNDCEIKWDVEIKLEEPLEIQELHTNVMLSNEYANWFTTIEKGEFSQIDYNSKSWNALIGNNVFRKCIGVTENENSGNKLPSLIFEQSSQLTNGYAQVYNSDYAANCRILQHKLFLLQNQSAIEAYQVAFFSWKMIVNMPNSHIKDYLVNLEDEYVLSCEKLKLVLNNGRITLNYNEGDITKANHIYSSIYANGKWYFSHSASWQVKKVNKNKIVAQYAWKDLPITQTLEMVIKDESLFTLNLAVTVNQEISIEEQHVCFMFLDKYQYWHSEYGDGAFPLKFFEINMDMLQRCIPEGIIGLCDKDSNLPHVSLKFFKNPNIFAKVFNSDFYHKSRVLRVEKVYPESNVRLPRGEYECFNIEVTLNEDKQMNIKESNKIISDRRLKFIFDKGKGELSWNGKIVTKHLGLYTSLRSNERWHDSFSSAIWKVGRAGDGEIKAEGKWLYLPITQYWELFLKEENILEFIVKMRVNQEVNIDRLQTNLMLSERYHRWSTDSKEGHFSFFKRDIDDNWDCIYSDNHNINHINILTAGEETIFPRIKFLIDKHNPGWSLNVVNSDIYHRGRVLQYSYSKPKIIAAGQYDYFHGKIILDGD